jgi:cation transporter-like permease
MLSKSVASGGRPKPKLVSLALISGLVEVVFVISLIARSKLLSLQSVMVNEDP